MITYFADYILISAHPLDSYPVFLKNAELSVDKTSGKIIGIRSIKNYKKTKKNKILIAPGFINAHTHTDLTFNHDISTPHIFSKWVLSLIEKRRNFTAKEKIDLRVKSFASFITSGTTSVSDIIDIESFYDMKEIKEQNALVPRVKAFIELRGLDPENAFQKIKDFKEIFKKNSFESIGISPHSIYSVSEKLFQEILKLNKELKLKIVIHASEHVSEKDFISGKGGDIAENLLPALNLSKYSLPQKLFKSPIFYLNYLKGSIAERKFDITTSMNYYKIALGFALELNKYNYMALIYKQLGNAYFYGGEIQNAENMYKKSLEYYDMISDYEGIARVYNNLALLDEADKDLKKTLDYYELSLSYANLSGNIYLLIIINYNIAEINFWNCKIEEAERGIKIAKNLSEMINEVDVRHSIFSFLSDVEKFKGNFIDALDYIERAISYSKKMDSIFYTSFYSLKKFELYSIIGRELDIDEINKDVENLKKINPRIYEPYTFGPLGKMKIYNGEIDEAIESLIKAYSVSPNLVSFVNYVDIVGNIPFAFALKGDFENFKKYVKDLISLSNSLKGNILHINAYIPSLKDGDSFSNSEKFLLENNLKFLLLIMYISYYSFNKDYSIKIKIVELSNEIGIRKDFINKLI